MRTDFSIINDGRKGRNLELRKYADDGIARATLLIDGEYFINIYSDDTYSIHDNECLKLSTHDLRGITAALAAIGYDVVRKPDVAKASEE